MLATGPATEIVPRQQNGGTVVPGKVQHEFAIRLPVFGPDADIPLIQKPPGVEQVVSEPRALDGLQELLGNNLIGIDIGPVQGRDQPSFQPETLSQDPPTSTK